MLLFSPKPQLFLFKRIIWTLSSRQSMVRKLNWIFFPDAGGLANGNMFGNFARWNEPSRGASGGESSKKVDYSLHVSQQPSNTGGGTSSSSFSSFQQNTMTRTFPGESSNGRLHIQVPLLLGETTDILSFFHILGRPFYQKTILSEKRDFALFFGVFSFNQIRQ